MHRRLVLGRSPLGWAVRPAVLLGALVAVGAQAPPQPDALPAPPPAPQGIWLGLLLRDAPDGGVEIVEVVPGSPAARSGIRAGDLVLRTNDRFTPDRRTLRRSLGSARPGAPLRFVVLRDGKTEDVTVVAAPKPELPFLPLLGEGSAETLGRWTAVELLSGLDLERITPELRRHLGAGPDQGVLVASIAPESVAQRVGLQAGDLLLRAGGTPLKEPNDLWLAVLTGSERPISLEVLRRGSPRPVRIRLPVDASRAPGEKALSEARARELEGAIARLRAQLATLEAELARLKRQR